VLWEYSLAGARGYAVGARRHQLGGGKMQLSNGTSPIYQWQIYRPRAYLGSLNDVVEQAVGIGPVLRYQSCRRRVDLMRWIALQTPSLFLTITVNSIYMLKDAALSKYIEFVT
jgi:hypothetical protein